jgi:ABC-type Fe3+/spermidine/putrescine transport system ATPase subunit
MAAETGRASDKSLHVEDLVVAYASQPVLKGISLSVRAGEFVALLGSSGCGKTTLLRAICGFVPVASGRIRVGERDIQDRPPDQRGMAMVFQSYALWPHMTVAQNIGYGLRLRRWPKARIQDRVAEILRMLKLEGFGGRRPAELSGGQRQRVALGRALAVEPGILLLDEPLSNLDARIRAEVRHEIKALQQALGITAIHVTHDREEAMVMADRVAILDAGAIAQVGAPEEVYNRPISPFVAAFMGAGNSIRLGARTLDGAVAIEPGPHNAGARLPARGAALDGPLVAHFRSEAASLVAPEAVEGDALILRGRVLQASYPGGFWRYTVEVGESQYMVDDSRRIAVGDPVGIRLAASALYLYPDAAERKRPAR